MSHIIKEMNAVQKDDGNKRWIMSQQACQNRSIMTITLTYEIMYFIGEGVPSFMQKGGTGSPCMITNHNFTDAISYKFNTGNFTIKNLQHSAVPNMALAEHLAE